MTEINLEQVEARFFTTFGKKFDRTEFKEACLSALKAKEAEFYRGLLSELSIDRLLRIRDELNEQKKGNPDTRYPEKKAGSGYPGNRK